MCVPLLICVFRPIAEPMLADTRSPDVVVTPKSREEPTRMSTKTSSQRAPKASMLRTRAKEADQRTQQAKRASILLKHVSDPTRLQVILILADGEQHVGSLCEELGQSQPAVSHHLALLRHGGIIAPRRQGKNNFYSLTESGTDLANVVKTLMT
jgi:DNA-binding transcriptional ArsR family regulator